MKRLYLHPMVSLILLFSAHFGLISCSCERSDHRLRVVDEEGHPVPHSIVLQSHEINYSESPIPPRAELTDSKGEYTFPDIPCSLSAAMNYSALDAKAQSHSERQAYKVDEHGQSMTLILKKQEPGFETLKNFNITKNTDAKTKRKLKKTKQIVYHKLLKTINEYTYVNYDETYTLWDQHPYPKRASVEKYSYYNNGDYAPYRYDEE